MGSQVGPYIVTRTIGQGTFGKVKLATHQKTGDECKRDTDAALLSFFDSHLEDWQRVSDILLSLPLPSTA